MPDTPLGVAASTSPKCSISPSGRELTIQAAAVDTVSGIEFALEHDIFDSKELLKLMCYLSQGPPVYQGVESRKELDAARACVSSNVDSAPRPSLLEAIAFTMVAGHVNDQRITHAQPADGSARL